MSQRGRLSRLLPVGLWVAGVACGGEGLQSPSPQEESSAPPSDEAVAQPAVPPATPSPPEALLPGAPAPPPPPETPRPEAPRQAPWAERRGGPQDDTGQAVAVDGGGDILWVWTATPREDSGREPVDGEQRALVLARHAPGGEVRWRREYARHRVAGPRVGAASDGTLVLGGNAFLYPVDFGLGAAQDGFLVRFSSEGEPLWQRRAGQQVHGLAVEAGGEVLASAEEWEAGARVPRLVRYGADGQVRWERRLGPVSQGTALEAVAHGPSGLALVAGTLEGTLVLDGHTLGAPGVRTLVLLALGPEGHLAWAREARDVDARVTGLAVGPEGALALAGDFQGTLSWAGTTLRGGGPFVLLASGDGQPRWLRRPACGGLEAPPSVVAEASGVAVGCGDAVTRLGADGALREELRLGPHSCRSGRCTVTSTALASAPGGALVVTGFQRDGASQDWDEDALLRLLSP